MARARRARPFGYECRRRSGGTEHSFVYESPRPRRKPPTILGLMLIEDRSTTPDYPPRSPRRWPKRLLVGGLVTLVLAAVAAFVVSAFALSGSSIEPDGSSLGKVSTDSFGGEVSSVSATAVKSGKDVPVKFEGDRIVPTGKVARGRGNQGRSEGQAAERDRLPRRRHQDGEPDGDDARGEAGTEVADREERQEPAPDLRPAGLRNRLRDARRNDAPPASPSRPRASPSANSRRPGS